MHLILTSRITRYSLALYQQEPATPRHHVSTQLAAEPMVFAATLQLNVVQAIALPIATQKPNVGSMPLRPLRSVH